MKRRVRPLEPGEQRSVDLHEPITIDIMSAEESRDYSLRWPESALAKRIVAAARRTVSRRPNSTTSSAVDSSSSIKCEAQTSDPVAPGVPKAAGDAISVPGTHPRHIRTAHAIPLKRPREKSDAASSAVAFTMPTTWLAELQKIISLQTGDAALGRAMVRDDELIWALERRVVRWEARLFGYPEKGLRALQPISAVVPPPRCAEDSTVSFTKAGMSKLAAIAAYDLWVRHRSATASASRPWGQALVLEFHEPVPDDEYFIVTSVENGSSVAGANNAATTTSRNGAGGTSGPGTRGRRQRAVATVATGSESFSGEEVYFRWQLRQPTDALWYLSTRDPVETGLWTSSGGDGLQPTLNATYLDRPNFFSEMELRNVDWTAPARDIPDLIWNLASDLAEKYVFPGEITERGDTKNDAAR